MNNEFLMLAYTKLTNKYQSILDSLERSKLNLEKQDECTSNLRMLVEINKKIKFYENALKSLDLIYKTILGYCESPDFCKQDGFELYVKDAKVYFVIEYLIELGFVPKVGIEDDCIRILVDF